MSNPQCFYVHIIFTAFYMVYFQCFICVLFQAWHLSLFRQDEWRVELWNLKHDTMKTLVETSLLICSPLIQTVPDLR